MQTDVLKADVAVIGAGQAGLSAGYHLKRLGFVNALENPLGEKTFIIFDENASPGGAWQHRWRSLSMQTVNGIFDLPDFPKPAIDPASESRVAVPNYFEAFEKQMELPIVRPVSVKQVTAETKPATSFSIEVTNSHGDGTQTWKVKAIINATGTWNNPLIPEFSGAKKFEGEILHTKDFIEASDFVGKRVAIVGAGISALQLLEEISRHTKTFWYTRNKPDFRGGSFRAEVEGRDVIERVTADAEAGLPAKSVVSYTGLPWLPYMEEAKKRGALEHRPMFIDIERHGVREADGSFTSVDVILWATGFRADLRHLQALQLYNSRGGVQVNGTQVVLEPRIHLIGYGPSQSTVGANRAGRQAAISLTKILEKEV